MANTNSDVYFGLSDKDKQHFLDTYENHPLKDYIDWNAFYRSNDGNEMHFVKALRTRQNEDGGMVYVLKEVVENDEDYEVVYDTTENEIQKLPLLPPNER